MTCHRLFIMTCLIIGLSSSIYAQEPVPVGLGSYASFPPLSESRSTEHGGCLAYQTDHRHLYIEDSLAARPVPTNDWWTYALVNQWTGNLWSYPVMVKAENGIININYPDYWEPTGCEMKWNKTLSISATDFRPQEAIISDWSDFSISFVMRDGERYVKTTLMMGSPIVWMEFVGLKPEYTNPLPDAFATFEMTDDKANYLSVGLLTDGLTANDLRAFAFHIPVNTRIDYAYNQKESQLTTTFRITTFNPDGSKSRNVLAGFIPHHYRNTKLGFEFRKGQFQTPRGTLQLASGNDFQITYDVHTMLPYFPAPQTDLKGYDFERMRTMIADYAKKGSFGADTYWGGKGLTQMAHYMTFAQQIGDQKLFEQTKARLKEALVNWLTYTPGEKDFFFASYPRFGALVGFNPSYDSDTFNDHHFHYGYFVYSAALLCLFDDDFRQGYGDMAREVALDYACWLRKTDRYPMFRTFNPWLGHSFAGGMGSEGGNGQESSSEAMQGWGAVWMLGAALNDSEMLEAGIFGYTLESRGTAEYWFDRNRKNIQYDKYQHPYCCNLTSQGVGWWTWFSGDPVWMHSIQWLPISPLLTNYLAEDTTFARWDYTQMYQTKEIGNYEALTGGLGDESGLGNVCLSYLSLFDPDSAARVFERAWNQNKALAKNADTGGITYWLTHSHRSLGDRRFDIRADFPLAASYTNNTTGITTHAVYNSTDNEQDVVFTMPNGSTQRFRAPAQQLTLFTDAAKLTNIALEAPKVMEPKSDTTLTLHFYDQYGAMFRNDSIITYTAPETPGITTINANYKGLTASAQVRIGELPIIKTGQIIPAVKYVQTGDAIDFTLSATDQYGEPYKTDWKEHFTATKVGGQTVSCTIGKQTYTHSFKVLPPYPNLALGKPADCSSNENGGTIAANVNDGDMSTRWGSAHKDGESITINLKELCYIRNIVVHWEAAYATDYLIEISIDGKTWTTYQQTCSGGRVSTPINNDAQYIRLTGITRATQYGISIYELEAFGIAYSAPAGELFGLQITSDRKVLNVGDSATFAIHGYNLNGEEIRFVPNVAIITNNAHFEGNTITCPVAGEVTLRAVAEGKSADYTWIVQETEQIIDVSITPKEITIPIGTSQIFIVDALNQFSIAEETQYIPFRADELGDKQIIGTYNGMSDTAIVHVVNFSDVNLALQKPVTISGNENAGTDGDKAVDGNFNTRWSSRFQDEEWIEIDLLNTYYLTSFKLFWEASYATSYTIELSTDGKEYINVYSTTESKGDEQNIDIDETLGRYVRLTCHTRNSGYGSSLWEFEVYGSGIVDTRLSTVNEADIDFTQQTEIYNFIGQRVAQGIYNLNDLCQLLPKGIYIIRQNEKTLKVRL